MGSLKVHTNFYWKKKNRRINILVTYGNSQEFDKVDIDMNKYIPIDMRPRYNYHIVSKGWDTYGPNQGY